MIHFDEYGHFLSKGDWVKAITQKASTPALAGMQTKLQVTTEIVVGEVMHIRGDHPTNPTTIGLWLRSGPGCEEVVVDSKYVCKLIAVNSQVNAGKPFTEDYDEGRIIQVKGDLAEVAWTGSGVRTWTLISDLSPGLADAWPEGPTEIP